MPYSCSRTAATGTINTGQDNLLNIGAGAFSLRMEIYVRASTAFAFFCDVTKAGASTGSGLRIGNASGSTFNLLWTESRNTSNGAHCSPDAGLSIGRWYVVHVTRTDYSGGGNPTVSIYVDGTSVGTGGTGTAAGSGTPATLSGVGSRMYVAGRQPSAAPSCLVRNVRMWNRVLSAGEIATDAVTEIADETNRILSATLDAGLSCTLRDGSSPDGTAITLATSGDIVRVDVDDLSGYDSKICCYLDSRSGATDAITYSVGAANRWVSRQASAWADRTTCAYYTNGTGSTSFQPWQASSPTAIILDGRDRGNVPDGVVLSTDTEVCKFLTTGAFSFTGASWVSGTKTLTKTGAFTNLSSTITAGLNDKIVIQQSDVTGSTYGVYTIASRTSADAIVLTTSFGPDAADVDGYGGIQVAPYLNSRNMTYYAVVAARNVRSATARVLLTTMAGGVKLSQEADGFLGVNGVTSTNAGAILPSGMTVFAAVCTASAIYVYRDGQLVDTLAAASNVNEYLTGLNATLRNGGGFEGAVGCVLVYQAQHTAAQVGAVTTILAARHSITTNKTGVLWIDGSSSAAGFYAYYNETATYRLSQMAAFSRYRIYNFGQGGATLSTMTTKAPNQIDKVVVGVADVIGIVDNVGSNDIAATSTNTDVLSALSTYNTARRAVCPTMKLVVTSMQPRTGVTNDATKSGYASALNAALGSQTYINAAVRRDTMWQFKSDGSAVAAADQPYATDNSACADTTHRNNAGFDAEFGPLLAGVLSAAGSQRTLTSGLGATALAGGSARGRP